MEFGLAISTAGASFTLIDLLSRAKGSLIAPKKDPFLKYDSNDLLRIYAEETTVAPYIPYTELACLYPNKPKINIAVAARKFALKFPDDEWTRLSNLAYAQLEQSKRIRDNESTIRLQKIAVNDHITLNLQQASYMDQCRSNLVLDWQDVSRDNQSLRTLSTARYGRKLPPLDDKSLANTIGIAALIFYRENGELVPYLVKRTKKVGVFPGGVHCTSSGVAKWPGDNADLDFETFFTEHMFSEIHEEVGLLPEDIDELVPLAICRELGRGGKPQIFYAGFTSLTREQLTEKRTRAQNTIKVTKMWPEIEQEKWYHSEIVLKSSDLIESVQKYKITLEGAAALFYGNQYLKAHVRE